MSLVCRVRRHYTLKQMTKTYIIILSAIPLCLFISLAHFIGVMAVDGKGELCQSCHTMAGPCESQRLSTHGGVRCSDCHIEGQSWFHRETSALNLLMSCGYAELTGVSFSAPGVKSSRCTNCHSRHYVMKPLSDDKHLPHPHSECTDCHQGVVHGTYDKQLLELKLKEQGRSLKVTADFPLMLSRRFMQKPHFQTDFVQTMGFCGSCHRMSPQASDVNPSVLVKGSSLCESCHVRY
jgi:nitrate/TMAO reductase-like tetraheme cytochrome c subunit